MMRRFNPLFAALFVAGVALVSPPSFASGGGEESPPEFNSPWGPVRPIGELASGSLGAVEASWWRKPLLLAWYRFNGQPIAVKALNAFEYIDQSSAADGESAAVAWLSQAKAVAAVPAPARVTGITHSVVGSQWDTFENCPHAAWEQARQTLAERSKTWGAESPALHDWLQAQHRVFARCPLGPTYFRQELAQTGRGNPQYHQQFVLPNMALPDPPANAPALLAKDRAYQRAAALLYEGNYQAAEEAFKKIARDSASPWQEWGMYLAFRARLRSIQMTAPAENFYDPCQTPECMQRRSDARALKATESARLREDVAHAIRVAQRANKQVEAKRLADLDALIGARLDPARRFAELAEVLTNPGVDADATRRAVKDYMLLHRQFSPSEPMGEWLAGLINGYDPTPTPCRTGAGAPAPGSPSPDSAETECRRLQWSQESLRRFEQKPTHFAWLFSAAALAHRNDPHVGKLLALMDKVPEAHPGAATFMLQRIRLGGREDGLRLADALMERPDITSDYSARNRVREYRFWHAASISDICRDALREPGAAFDRDTLMRTQTPTPQTEPIGRDYDIHWVLNYELPHPALIALAQHAECPAPLRASAAAIAWSRAILREDVAHARQAAAVWSAIKGADIPRWIVPNSTAADDKAFLLEGGLAIAGARIGGTCRIAAPRADEYTPDYKESVGSLPSNLGHFAKNVLNPEHYAQWQRERKWLDALPDLDSLWMQNVLAFAEAFPTDARVPGLLRDAVYRTRMNWCAEKSAGKLSKAAFDLLKSKYPKSKEAQTTKYWFKPGT